MGCDGSTAIFCEGLGDKSGRIFSLFIKHLTLGIRLDKLL
jgi:hypothetical protein